MTTSFLVTRMDFGEPLADIAIVRLHGLPVAVMPLHVVAGFLESDRERRDSGVLGTNGISASETVDQKE